MMRALAVSIALVLSACASSPFSPLPLESASFLERAVTDSIDGIRVHTAVPSRAETSEWFGLNLYAEGIQPVWLQVENGTEKNIRVALYSVDEEYYAPLEVAWLFRKEVVKDARIDMEKWFYENQMPRRIPPGATRSGFVFTHVSEGTKAFNLDVYDRDTAYPFTFFVPMPGFQADYQRIDFSTLYAPDEIQKLDESELRDALNHHTCCSTDESGELLGEPLNVVLVGTPKAVRRSLLRGGWQETGSGSSLTGVARMHRYRGRIPDGTFHKSRPDGRERKELRLWLSPMRLEDESVWIGQISYDMSGAVGEKAFEQYQIDPDLDDARNFLIQNFWYNQALAKFAFVGGVPASTISDAASNFTGQTYFTDGNRAVMFLSEGPVGFDEVDVVNWQEGDQ